MMVLLINTFIKLLIKPSFHFLEIIFKIDAPGGKNPELSYGHSKYPFPILNVPPDRMLRFTGDYLPGKMHLWAVYRKISQFQQQYYLLAWYWMNFRHKSNLQIKPA